MDSINKRTFDRMMKWDFIEMGELQVKRYSEKALVESDTDNFT